MPTNPVSFAHLPLTPAEHFRLHYLAAVLRVIAQASQSLGGAEEALARYPFLQGYQDELVSCGLDGATFGEAAGWWEESLAEWERGATVHLPLAALAEAAGFERSTVLLLIAVGLAEEDSRFGLLFEEMQGSPGQRRPSAALLCGWWNEPWPGDGVPLRPRDALRRLIELGLVEVADPSAPRGEWPLLVPGILWDALRGDAVHQPAPWLRFRPFAELLNRADLILPPDLAESLALVPDMLVHGEVQAVILRGPGGSGRRSILGALARELGSGLLEAADVEPTAQGWRMLGPLATLMHALPVVVLDPAPGETVELPRINGYTGPLGIVLGRQGGVSGPSVEAALTLVLEMPDAAARRRHWLAALGERPAPELEEMAGRFRMTGGNIRHAASLAGFYAHLQGREEVLLSDVRQASRALNRQALDTLAVHVPATGDWSHLVGSNDTLRDLCDLERRCRYREQLQSVTGVALQGQLNAGVRALFSGPSGTGKTLAARLLASVLQMDLYRLDLSAVVNKYIGETEKNLDRILTRSEELDVILLLDEGDALLTRRTRVETANDRYANLETNFLLQRLESFEGILIVTTNAGDRIDSAFQRRMDVVVEFRPPDVEERWLLWQLHLPATHVVELTFLSEVAERCEMTGGAVRNASLYASLLALDSRDNVRAEHVEAAVQREYRKLGAVCPLRRYGIASYR